MHDLEQPSWGEWVRAGVAAIFAGALIVGLLWFAGFATRHTSLVNLFGLVTAIGGAFVFEAIKYAATVRRRHRDELAVTINLTPVKVQTLHGLREELKQTQQIRHVLDAAIEVRAREHFLDQQRTQLRDRITQLAADLDALQDQERRLTLERADPHLNDERIQTLMRSLGAPQKTTLERAAEGLMPFPYSNLPQALVYAVQYAARYVATVLSRRRWQHKRALAQQADNGDADFSDASPTHTEDAST